MAVVVKRLEKAPYLRHDMRCKVKTAGNVTEVLVSTSSTSSDGCPCRRISGNEYVDLRDGEIHEYDHTENRAENERSFWRTLNRIRDLINVNVTDARKCRFVTFTYRENMTDTERLMNDWKAFWRRFQRWCKRSGVSVPEYIAVIEPQGRGAWHLHVVFIWESVAPYISNNDVMEPLWRQGFTKTQAIKGSVDNIGAYFSAYLTDIPIEEFSGDQSRETVLVKEFTDQKGRKTEKRFIKGARTRLYPSGMNIVRHSRGLKEPTIEEMTYAEAKEKVSGATETFRKSFTVQYDTGEEITTYVKTYYNTARKQQQESEVKAGEEEEKREDKSVKDSEEGTACRCSCLAEAPTASARGPVAGAGTEPNTTQRKEGNAVLH